MEVGEDVEELRASNDSIRAAAASNSEDETGMMASGVVVAP